MSGRGAAAADRAITVAVERWFAANRRDLPWRTTPRDPWASLVSEVMLQQTQAARVAERLPGFLARFPTPSALASADEHDVLAAWAGLGYYRRARSLRACAAAIVERFGGAPPADAADLRSLPGVGAYTAGAIASVVFGRREPIVDANVARVLLRLEGRALDPKAPATASWAWERAGSLVLACADPAACNEGLMELGALVCTPRAPRCGACPLRRRCVAAREGLQGRIPAATPRRERPRVHHAAVVVRDRAGRVLLERRPAKGLWAGFWQPVTVESSAGEPEPGDLAAGLGVRAPTLLGRFTCTTTHRLVEFSVWSAAGPGRRTPARGQWKAPGEVAGLALATPHRRVLALAGVVAPGRGGEVRSGGYTLCPADDPGRAPGRTGTPSPPQRGAGLDRHGASRTARGASRR